MFAFVCVVVVVSLSPVADGVIEEENAEDLGGQYRVPEQEDPYRE